ncbi:hypothetical protein QMT40_001203 [Parvibaculaceae bacterium PLY_AMNH_Bact1]|nr:hypothetical protein QMT40_001203 [Parvibaculaceae bacterium PLY_AMNH_Bact1]
MSSVVVKSEAMIAFASLWYDARDEAGVSIPAKSDLPLRGLAAFMPNLLLHRIDENGHAFCLLFGTALTDAFGENLTGTYLEERMTTVDATKRRETFEAFYREHGEGTPFGRWVSGTLNSRTGNVIGFESLAFPYIEPSDGSTRQMVHVLPLDNLSYGDRLIPHFAEETVHMFRPDGPRPAWLGPRSAI